MGVFGGESKMPKKAFLTPPPKKIKRKKRGFFPTIFGAFLAIFSKIPLLPRFIRLWDNSNIYRFFPHICWVLLEKTQRALWWHSDTRLARLAKQKKLLQVFISDGRNSKELSALPIEVEAELKTNPIATMQLPWGETFAKHIRCQKFSWYGTYVSWYRRYLWSWYGSIYTIIWNLQAEILNRCSYKQISALN